MGDMNKKTLPIIGDDIKSKIGGGGGCYSSWCITPITMHNKPVILHFTLSISFPKIYIQIFLK